MAKTSHARRWLNPILHADMRNSVPLRIGRHPFLKQHHSKMALSSMVSASSFFSLAFSSSKASSLEASEIYMPANVALYLEGRFGYPCLRQTSAVLSPFSCSFNIPIICSSVNRQCFILSVSAE
jgi:hypothetical protein